MLEQGLDYVVKLAKSKKKILDTNPMQYFIRPHLLVFISVLLLYYVLN